MLPRDVLARQGETLDQLGGLLALHPLTTEVHYAADGGLETQSRRPPPFMTLTINRAVVRRSSLEPDPD